MCRSRRRWWVLLALVLLILPVGAEGVMPIRVEVNGELLVFDTPPVEQGGRLLVPMRTIFERLGADVVYDPVSRTVRATSEGAAIVLRLGDRSATVNGVPRLLDTPALSLQGRTLVPLRFVSEALNAEVKWSAMERLVRIQTAGVAGPAPVFSTPPTPGASRITSVRHSATRPLRTGEILTVTMTGPPGGNASFDVSGDARGIPMAEASPGTYVGSYTVPNRMVQNAAIVAHLRIGGEDLQFVAPSMVSFGGAPALSVTPPQGSAIPDLRPQIAAVFDEIRGPAVESQSLRLFVDGQDVTPWTVRSRGEIRYVPSAPLAGGVHRVFLQGRDMNGAPFEERWEFQIAPPTSQLSVSHNAAGILRAGDILAVTMHGPSGGHASFSIGGWRTNLPMTEHFDTPGLYTGTYIVQPGDRIPDTPITASLTTLDGRRLDVRAAAPVRVEALALKPPPTITTSLGELDHDRLLAAIRQGVYFSPDTLQEAIRRGVATADEIQAARHQVPLTLPLQLSSPPSGGTVGSSFHIAGATRPQAAVTIVVEREGRSIIPGLLTMGGGRQTFETTANNQGEFSFEIVVPQSIPNGIRYTITAVARNAQGTESAPQQVTVTYKK